jgi:peptidoglycan-N-acetylmuramic acid deacetylase
MKKLTCLLFIVIIIVACFTSGCGKPAAVSEAEETALPIRETVQPETETPALAEDETPVNREEPSSSLSAENKTLSWYYVRNQEHKTPRTNTDLGFSLADYDAYYVGSKEKVIFLTFDEGYENGYTPQILDILKANQVKAAFFVTGPYVTGNPELVKRMVAEGHIVGNHSQTHPSMPAKTGNPEAFKQEFTAVEDSFQALIGTRMPNFFRPPRGEYSEKSLQMTKELGYKTIFWSFAYQDWLVDQQPDPESSYQKIMQGTHNGQIMLLHAVSATNTQILDRVIKDIQSEGYRFAPLTELEQI